MLLDQRTHVFDATFTSIRSVSRNLPAMIFVAASIAALLVGCAMSSWLGPALVFPWFGFASWHAYRKVVV